MPAIAGFLLASGRDVDWWKLLATTLGIALIVGSGCVFNNYLDRDIDKQMQRTKSRPSATGLVGVRSALIYATCLGALGFALLLRYTNITTALIGIIGLVDYVVLYGYAKRKSVYGTLVGSISGATPPLAGFTAVSGHLDTGGLLLFLILAFWQMPHFYAIAMYRLKDYKSAKIPVFPAVRGMAATKLHIVVYIFWFIVATVLLFLDGFVGIPYLVVMVLVGLWWFSSALLGFRSGTADTRWARGIFFQSLVVITVFCVTVSASALLSRGVH
jgi:protoheme IX farnesyltransferase